LLTALLVAAGLLGGCGQAAASHPAATVSASSAAVVASSATGNLQAVTFRLDFVPEGYQAPFAYGVAAGIYRRYGIALHIVPSSSSQVTVETTAKGE
jgi:ABC-type nitrate/sulfonate/bicarbonate transport system substrate-binding protein